MKERASPSLSAYCSSSSNSQSTSLMRTRMPGRLHGGWGGGQCRAVQCSAVCVWDRRCPREARRELHSSEGATTRTDGAAPLSPITTARRHTHIVSPARKSSGRSSSRCCRIHARAARIVTVPPLLSPPLLASASCVMLTLSKRFTLPKRSSRPPLRSAAESEHVSVSAQRHSATASRQRCTAGAPHLRSIVTVTMARSRRVHERRPRPVSTTRIPSPAARARRPNYGAQTALVDDEEGQQGGPPP